MSAANPSAASGRPPAGPAWFGALAWVAAAAMFAVTGMAAAPAAAPAKVPTPPPAPSAAQLQANKRLVSRYLTEVLAAGNLDKIDEIVSPTFADRSPNAVRRAGQGAELAREAVRRQHSLFSKLEYDPQEMIAEGDRVAVRYLIQGTPRPERGQPAPPPVVFDGMALFRLRNGRLQEIFVVNDFVNYLSQLGYTMQPTPSPGHTPAAASPPAAAPPAAPGNQTASPPPAAASLPPSANPAPPPPA